MKGKVNKAGIAIKGRATSWVYGRNTAPVRVDSIPNNTSYQPIFSAKTYGGSWEGGTYTDNHFWLTYISDTNYAANTNTPTRQFSFTPSGNIGGVQSINSKSIIDLSYPVGSIYMSVFDTNPKLLFGGTWEQIQGRFLLAAGGGYAAGSTGGEASHTLTVEEVPSLKTGFNTRGNDSTNGRHFWATQDGKFKVEAREFSSDKATAFQRTSATNIPTMDYILHTEGGGNSHNNMPPYLVVNIWQRTA